MDKSDLMKCICDALKKIRVLSGKSRKELAELLGLSENHLREIESARRNPHINLLEKYRDVYGVKVSDIVRLAEMIQEGKYPVYLNERVVIKALLYEILKNSWEKR